MAYLNVSENYNEVIYSGDAKTRPILKINGVVVNDLDTPVADNTISSIKKVHNIIKTGNNRFSLDNFVAQELEIQIYDFDYSIYANPSLGANQYNVIDLSLSTLTGTQELSTITEEIWETVPIGIFNIIGTPTTDKGLTTIKAKCNRIKFDIPYNAKPIIDDGGGKVQIGALLQDICLKCGVELGTELPFTNSTSEIGVYDNTTNANIYVSYICELAGCIAVLGRDGKLYLIPINNDLYKHIIDVDLIKGQGTLVLGDGFTFDRVCYEFGVDKYATPQNETPNTTIYINSANPYVSTQEEIDNIYNEVVGFNIKNMQFETMGNPCIDAWDIVSFTKDDIEHKTLANNTLIFNGVLTQKFDTSIGTKETVKENVTIKGTATQQKYIKTEIDRTNASLLITAEQAYTNAIAIDETNGAVATTQTDLLNTTELANNAIDNSTLALEGVETLEETTAGLNDTTTDLTERLEYQETTVSDLLLDVDGVKQSMTYSGGYNLIENCVKQFGEAGWTGTFVNYSDTEIQQNSLTKSALVFMNDTETREIQVENRTHNFSFKYKKLVPLATATITINGIEIELTEDEWTEVEQNIEVTDNRVEIVFSSDADDSVWLVDMLLIPGNIQQIWTPNPNEINTGIIKLGGDTLTIESNSTTTKFVASTDGTRVYNTNDLKTNPNADPIAEFTSEGVWTKTITGTKGEISKVLIVDMGTQTWFSRM